MVEKQVNLSLASTPGKVPPQRDRKSVPGTVGISALIERESAGGPLPIPCSKLSILVPVYNEEKTVGRVISSLLAVDYPCDFEIIVVNDGSTDATSRRLSLVRNPRVVLARHSRNFGKGVALRTGASMATGTHLLPFDADLEYDPHDIPRVLGPVVAGRCDVVYGARVSGINTVYQSYRYAFGNKVLTFTANLLYDAHLADLHTCLKLVPVDIFKQLSLTEPGFGLDTELTALLLRAGYRPFEVPVSYHSRSHTEGKKITWWDGVNCMRILMRIRVDPRPAPTRGSPPPGPAAGPEGGSGAQVTPLHGTGELYGTGEFHGAGELV